jgi:4a-hydroxytetrahydrobiopterin dehydratase
MPERLTPDEISTVLAELPGVVQAPLGSLSVRVELPSPAAAVATIHEIATDADAANHHPDLDLRYRTVTTTSTTHDVGGISDLDEAVVRNVLRVAKAHGGTVAAPPPRIEIAIDALHPARIAPFWAAGLDYRMRRDAKGLEVHDPRGEGPVVWFQQMDQPRTERSRIHIDVYLPLDEVPSRIQACLDAGGVLLTEQYAPLWWVLADVEGNELCLCTHEPSA